MERNFKVMGIINLTDNSYYAASRHLLSDGSVDIERVRLDMECMLSRGADIIDLGACSTRPGAAAVGAEEEWRRLKAVLGMIASEFPEVPVSVDTYWASVVERSHALLGDRLIVNDVWAGNRDPQMLPLVGRLGLRYIAMHNCGETTAEGSYPDGVILGVIDFFREFEQKAEAVGIHDWILDPGFGFSKTIEENWTLLRGLSAVKEAFPERELLVGISRKSMIYKPLGITPEEALPATAEAHRLALEQGADILRVHDVPAAV